jgi:hypothetical protein
MHLASSCRSSRVDDAASLPLSRREPGGTPGEAARPIAECRQASVGVRLCTDAVT